MTSAEQVEFMCDRCGLREIEPRKPGERRDGTDRQPRPLGWHTLYSPNPMPGLIMGRDHDLCRDCSGDFERFMANQTVASAGVAGSERPQAVTA